MHLEGLKHLYSRSNLKKLEMVQMIDSRRYIGIVKEVVTGPTGPKMGPA